MVDQSIFIKFNKNWFGIVVWGWVLLDRRTQTNKLQETYIYINNFTEKVLCNLLDKSNKKFRRLYHEKFITEKYLKYFFCSFRTTICVDKIYLPRDVKKKIILEEKTWCSRTSCDFLKKLEKFWKVPSKIIFVKADVAILYHSTWHDYGL